MKEKRKPLTVERVKELLAAGLTDQQVAVATGHTPNHAKCFRVRHRLPCNPEMRSRVLNIEAVRALVAEGWASTKIAAAFGTDKSTVYSAMEANGITPAHQSGRKRKTKRSGE